MYSLILIQLVYVIAGVMDPIRFVMLLYMGTCNCVFFYFDIACFFDSWCDGSHKVRNTIMYVWVHVTVYSFILIQHYSLLV